MPTYPFVCPECGATAEVIRPMRESGDPLRCECGVDMRRVYTVPHGVVHSYGYYDHGLGAYIGNRADKRDAMQRIRDGGKRDYYYRETPSSPVQRTTIEAPGFAIEEVGDQRPAVTSKRADYHDIPSAALDSIVK